MAAHLRCWQHVEREELRMSRISPIATAGAVLFMLASGSAGAADPLAMSGKDLYHRYCATCHGAGGEGDGPVAPSLKVQVPDLTLIAQRQGGKFQRDRVERTIDGRAQVLTHGPRDMPVWGEEFWRLDLGNPDLGVDNPQSKSVTATIIQRLVDYVESLQKPVKSNSPDNEPTAH